MKVTLSWAEVAVAARVGEARTIRNRAAGNAQRHGKAQGADWSGDIEAAAAELAAARVLGVYWPIVAEADSWGDLGYGLHVRHTAHENGCLILHKDDQPAHFYICVIGSVPTFNVAGFMLAAEGQQDSYWSDPSGQNRPAYFIPQSDLVPITGLVALRPINPPEGWPDAYTPPAKGSSQ